MATDADRLDSRAWIAWGVAAMVPVLIGRNPLVIAEVLLTVTVVRRAWAPRIEMTGSGWLVRAGGLVLAVSVLFNLLTVRAGDVVLARLPDAWPIVGGPLTLNALVYGVISAMALFTLLLIGTTTAGLFSWMDLFHLLPQRLAPIAVAGSVTWAFLPRTATALRQIRETQTLRGHRWRGGRLSLPLLVPLVVPLLAGGLERSLTTAEVLEARGFGTSLAPGGERRPWRWASPLAVSLALVALLAGAYCLLAGFWLAAAGLIAAGAAVLLAALKLPRERYRRTRYRELPWRRADTVVTAASAFVLVSVILRSVMVPEGLRFNPYPTIQPPGVDLLLLLALSGLLVPAAFAPSDPR